MTGLWPQSRSHKDPESGGAVGLGLILVGWVETELGEGEGARKLGLDPAYENIPSSSLTEWSLKRSDG